MARRRTENLDVSVPQTAQNTARSNRGDEIDLVALAMAMLEKIHWILLAAFLGVLIAGAYVFVLATPIYEAVSKIYIVGSESAISLSDLQIGTNLAADYQEVFKTWHVHELMDRRLNLNYSYTDLAKMVSVSNPTGTHVLYVRVKSPNPEEAKLLADTYAGMAREFIASKMDMREPNIFEEARLPASPVSPSKTRDIIIGFLLGALLAMAVVTVRFLSDDRICTGEDIAKVGGLPTLGLVPLQDLKGNAEKGAPSSAYASRAKQKGKE